MSKTESAVTQPNDGASVSAAELLLHEYDALRDEVMECVKESRLLERNALLASGAIWAWALANKSQPVYQALLFVPVLITLLSTLRSWALKKHLDQLGEYITRVEAHAQLPKHLGWERQFAKSADKSKSRSAIAFWVVLTFATAFGAWAYGK